MYIAVITKGFCLHKRTSFASFLRIHKQVIAVLTQSGCILILMILPAVKFDHLSNHLLLSLSFYIKLILAHFLSFYYMSYLSISSTWYNPRVQTHQSVFSYQRQPFHLYVQKYSRHNPYIRCAPCIRL